MSYENKKKDAFLAKIVVASIEDDGDTLTARCKFNFSYFEKQPAGQAFEEWTHPQLCKLLDKLKEYCRQPLAYWKQNGILAVYGAFPRKQSDFEHPKHVPHQAMWGRFRLESAVRLVGFVVPPEFASKVHQKTGIAFDCNTFYVVFLDADHRFYRVEKK